MTTQELRTVPSIMDPKIMESLVLRGDLGGLDARQKVEYYAYRCQQAGLDPSAKPFDIMTFQGKQVLYANKSCTEQLTRIHNLSHTITARELVGGIYCVFCKVSDPHGRSTENMGSVPVEGLKGEALSNAYLKATTKAIRRTVLAFCGLGMLDETEEESLAIIDQETGWTDEERDNAKLIVADLAECLFNAGYDEENPKHQKTVQKYRDEIGEGTFENWANRVAGAAARIKENPVKKEEPTPDPIPAPSVQENSNPSSASSLDLTDLEDSELSLKVASGWNELDRKWNSETADGRRLANAHLSNRRAKRISEWAPGLKQGSREWCIAVIDGQTAELTNANP